MHVPIESIPYPTDRPSAEALIARARELLPALQRRSADAIARRRLPEETLTDMKEAGLFAVLQPSRWGGYEHDPQVFFEIQMALAEGCPSTAWVYGVVCVHNWQLALFDPQAQEEVWGANNTDLVSSSYMPVGQVERVDGGFRLSGRWGFSSGSDHCKWAFLGAFVPPETENQPPDMRTFLVPRSDYQIEDTWHVAGLAATGSNDIVVDNAFVPEHRTHRFADGFRCESPGHSVNTAPLYRLPFGQIFVRSVSTPAIGMARGALAHFRRQAAERVSRADGMRATENPFAQRMAAQAASAIDTAHSGLHRTFDAMMRHARANEPIPLEDRVRYRYESARTVSQCVMAVDNLLQASGSGGIFLDHPIQRYWQDIHACRAHYANNPEKPAQNLGRLQLGHTNKDYFI